MKNVDLKKTAETIKNFIISKKFTLEKILLFGSRANFTADEMSDFDLVFIIKENLTFVERRKLLFGITKYLVERREMIPMDIIIKSENDFLNEKEIFGSLAYNISRENLALL